MSRPPYFSLYTTSNKRSRYGSYSSNPSIRDRGAETGGLSQVQYQPDIQKKAQSQNKTKQKETKKKNQFLQNFIWFYRTILFYFILKAIFLSGMGLVFDGMVSSVFMSGEIRPSHLEPHVAMEQRVL